MEMMIGRNEIRNPKNEHLLVLNVKSDYPMEMRTRRIGDDGSHIEAIGLVAPRVE